MQRVLLVIDDYGELLFLQTLLKKLGFDVDGIQNERSFEESFLSLNPDLIIATARGKRVNGLELAEGLRRNRGLPKILLLAQGPMFEKLKGLKIENVDGILESPVATTVFLTAVARVAALDEVALLEKYRKFKATLSPESEADLQILKRDAVGEPTSAPGISPAPVPAAEAERPQLQVTPTTLSEGDRRERFAKVLAQTEKPVVQQFNKDIVQRETKQIRASERREKIADLEDERQEFVRKLFRTAKRS